MTWRFVPRGASWSGPAWPPCSALWGVRSSVFGDERWRTQGGNNNAYCQDNEISWINWAKDETADQMAAFVSGLTRFRSETASLRRSAHFSGRPDPLTGRADVEWLDTDGGPCPTRNGMTRKDAPLARFWTAHCCSCSTIPRRRC